MSSLDFYTRKLAYIWLRMSEVLVNFIVWIYSILFAKKRKPIAVKKIGAYWYCPPDLTGSNIRLGGWTAYFENDGFSFDNFHINTLNEIIEADKPVNGWTKRYLMFAKCLWRRLPQMLKAHKYDVIWIDRSIIPEYPRKTAFLEKRLSKVVYKMVVDSTDGGDYLANPELMQGVFQAADELTVGYKYLMENYGKKFRVSQIFWTISTDNYQCKTAYNTGEKAIVGWMGSPGNFEHIKKIIPQLVSAYQDTPFEFHYICRENMDTFLEGIATKHYVYDDNYYTNLSRFDIGLSPSMTVDLRSQGKIAMKHQEFLLMGTPQICSPVAISEFVEHNEEVLIAQEADDWSALLTQLIKDENLRKKLGLKSKQLFDKYYNFEGQYEKLKFVLTNLNLNKTH